MEALELGRSGSTHVADFDNPSSVPEKQRFQTVKIASTPETEDLEFVRAWDATAISLISMMPFLLSRIFAGTWICFSVHRYGVDAQVATQTAFTVAAYIVTAGKDKVT